MATTLFDIAAERLEESTDMDRLAARGTLRLAVKEAGLDLQSLSLAQLRAVFEKLMPRELEARGASNAAAICTAVMNDVASIASTVDLTTSDSPDEIFKRLGGR
jgi:hypothetical protein